MTDNCNKCSATAPINVALIKYWGKRSDELNLPAGDSLSLTLSSLRSTVTVAFHGDGADDLYDVVGDPAKARRVVSRFRELTGIRQGLRVKSENNFPGGAGLASSASSMAALVTALAGLAESMPSEQQLAQLARLGSGSAVRSLLPGYVLWQAGQDLQGADCRARTLYPPDHLSLKVIAAIVDEGPKPLGSTAAMTLCRDTSPFYDAYLESSKRDLRLLRQALEAKEFAALAEIAEANALALHAVSITARPPVIYLKPSTLRVIETVRQLRADAIGCFFTIDAGPNVFIFCLDRDLERVKGRIAGLAGVRDVLVDGPGGEAAITQEHLF